MKKVACEDCKFYEYLVDMAYMPLGPVCHHPALAEEDLIRGRALAVDLPEARYEPKCGRSGKLFEKYVKPPSIFTRIGQWWEGRRAAKEERA